MPYSGYLQDLGICQGIGYSFFDSRWLEELEHLYCSFQGLFPSVLSTVSVAKLPERWLPIPSPSSCSQIIISVSESRFGLKTELLLDYALAIAWGRTRINYIGAALNSLLWIPMAILGVSRAAVPWALVVNFSVGSQSTPVSCL